MNADNIGNSALVQQKTERKSRRMFGIASVFLVLSFILFLCQLISFGVFPTRASESASLPISMRAASQADYSPDAQSYSIPFISRNILRQLIMDVPATGSPEDRLATLEVLLSQPIFTMTPDPLFPATFIPTRTVEPTASRLPSQTVAPTVSKVWTPTPAFTSTKVFQPAKTSTPVRTFAPIFTMTSTSTSTPTATITATATPTPTPTSTEAYTSTPTPTPTAVPPTNTFTPTPTPTNTPSCMLASSGISQSGRSLEMLITNNGGSAVVITGISVNWPDNPLSQMVTEVKLGDMVIVNSSEPEPPSDFPSERNWTGTESDRTLGASDSKLLALFFLEDLQAGGYSITIGFDNGCMLSESN